MEPWWHDTAAKPDSPGTYALVIGVSRYDHLPRRGERSEEEWTMGLSQLASAAISAAGFASWLRSDYIQPDAPPRAIWLLLSISPEEEEELDGEIRAAPASTTENVLEALKSWRSQCQSDSGNVAMLYAAGHGIASHRFDPGVLLLQDYGADRNGGLLEHALDLTAVHGKMAGSKEPGRQFSFLDACRPRPELTLRYDLAQAPPHWDVPLVPLAESWPMFLGAVTGSLSYGRPGIGTIFWEALRECLTNEAVDLLPNPRTNPSEVWGVSDDALAAPLRRRVAKLAQEAGVDQQTLSIGSFSGTPLHVLAKPPLTMHRFRVIPDVVQESAFATLRRDRATPAVFEDLPLREPATEEVPAGNYEFSVDLRPPILEFDHGRTPTFIRPRGLPETVLELARKDPSE
jgi:Caspase domain